MCIHCETQIGGLSLRSSRRRRSRSPGRLQARRAMGRYARRSGHGSIAR